MLVVSTAGTWQSEVGREVTVQVRPAPGRDIDADVDKAVALVRAANGIAEVQPYSKAQSQQLVEPWLHRNASLATPAKVAPGSAAPAPADRLQCGPWPSP